MCKVQKQDFTLTRVPILNSESEPDSKSELILEYINYLMA